MSQCLDCHHRGSERNDEMGWACYCPCHDLADHAGELLAACRQQLAALNGRPGDFVTMLAAHRALQAAVAHAEGPAHGTVPDRP